ncbi:MAG: hypothetical protein ACFE0Q_09170 [Anaerolineae bacterium]
MKNFIISIFVIGSILHMSNAQDTEDITWSYNSSNIIEDIVGTEYEFYKTTMSPNGRLIAWVENSRICLHEEETICHNLEWDEAFMNSQVGFNNVYLQWSLDSQYIALSQDPFFLGFDSDIWLFDTGDNDFVNLTEDNFDSVLVSGNMVYADIPVDFSPLWKSENELLFFRTFSASQDASISLEQYPYQELFLYSINVDTRETKLELDLTEHIAPGDVAGAVNSSGSILALVAPKLITDSDRNLEFGTWLINLDTYYLDFIVDTPKLERFLFTWLNVSFVYPTSNRSIVWHPSGDSIIMSFNWITEEGFIIPQQFWFEVESKSLNAIVDYSSIPIDDNSVEEYVSDIVIVPPTGEILYYIARTSDNEMQTLYLIETNSSETQYVQEVFFPRGFTDGVVSLSSNGLVMTSDLNIMEFTENE